MHKLFLLFVITLIGFSCNKEPLVSTAEQLIIDTNIINDHLIKNGITAQSTPEGLQYVITFDSNADKPTTGNTVVVNYAGRLLDGTPFDANDGFEFPLGLGRVIQGWDIGIALLSKGSKATLYIPSTLGYGTRGAGSVIGPNAILVFDVELVDFR